LDQQVKEKKQVGASKKRSLPSTAFLLLRRFGVSAFSRQHERMQRESSGVQIPQTKRVVVVHMGVSKNRGNPKWMVYNGKSY